MDAYLIPVALIALCAGILQGTSGMGGGMMMMLVLPWFFPLSQAAGVAGAVCLILTLSMVVRYRRAISFKKALPPTLLYVAASALAIRFSASVGQQLIKRVFGGFLILLAGYFLFLRKAPPKRFPPAVRVLFVAVSGACDGLFSIGSPLMALYFLSITDSKEEYLGTMQTLFCVSLLVNLFLRLYHGILGIALLPVIAAGGVCIFAGVQIANRIVDRINVLTIQRAAYVAIFISGLINLVRG